MNLREACNEALECLEMCMACNGADQARRQDYIERDPGIQLVINRIQSALKASADDVPASKVSEWRGNYRHLVQVLNEENNTLRELASYKSAQVLDLAAALEKATRKKWWQLWI